MIPCIYISFQDKYMDEWKLEMVEYRAKLEQFKKDHPEYYDKSPPRMSRTPLQIFNQELSPTLTSENVTIWLRILRYDFNYVKILIFPL